jgi:hypothetical protein
MIDNFWNDPVCHSVTKDWFSLYHLYIFIMYIICEYVISCGMMLEREEYVQFFIVVQMKPEHDIMWVSHIKSEKAHEKFPTEKNMTGW